MKAEEKRERERGKLEREAQRRKRREEKKQLMRKQGGGGGGGDRYEIVFHSGRKEVWVVPGSEEWCALRRGGGGGGGETTGSEGERKNDAVCEDSYNEPEEEVSSVRSLLEHLYSSLIPYLSSPSHSLFISFPPSHLSASVSLSPSLHSVQLVKQLTAAFLIVHGKLYTKIG